MAVLLNRKNFKTALPHMSVAPIYFWPVINSPKNVGHLLRVSYRSCNDKPISRLNVHIALYTNVGHFMFNCSSEASGFLVKHTWTVRPPAS
jgi:hypothetical protein